MICSVHFQVNSDIYTVNVTSVVVHYVRCARYHER